MKKCWFVARRRRKGKEERERGKRERESRWCLGLVPDTGPTKMHVFTIVRLNLINHVLALFRDIFVCNITLRNLVFRWESCKGSV